MSALFTPGSRDVLLCASSVSSDSMLAFDYQTGVQFSGYGVGGGVQFNFGTDLPLSITVSPNHDIAFFVRDNNTTLYGLAPTNWGWATGWPSLAAARSYSSYQINPRPVFVPGADYVLVVGGGTNMAARAIELNSKAATNFGPSASSLNAVAVSGNATVVALVGNTAPYVWAYSWPTLSAIALPGAAAASEYHHVAVSPNGRYIAILQYGTTLSTYVSIYDLVAGTKTAPVMLAYGSSICFTNDGAYLLVSCASTTYGMKVIDTATWAFVTHPTLSIGGLFSGMKKTADGRFILVAEATSSTQRFVHVLDGTTYALLKSFNVGTNVSLRDMDIATFGHTISNANGNPVTDAAGNPLSGVPVYAVNRSSGTVQNSTSTDVNGRFVLPCGNNLERQVLFLPTQVTKQAAIVDRVIPL